MQVITRVKASDIKCAWMLRSAYVYVQRPMYYYGNGSIVRFKQNNSFR